MLNSPSRKILVIFSRPSDDRPPCSRKSWSAKRDLGDPIEGLHFHRGLHVERQGQQRLEALRQERRPNLEFVDFQTESARPDLRETRQINRLVQGFYARLAQRHIDARSLKSAAQMDRVPAGEPSHEDGFDFGGGMSHFGFVLVRQEIAPGGYGLRGAKLFDRSDRPTTSPPLKVVSSLAFGAFRVGSPYAPRTLARSRACPS